MVSDSEMADAPGLEKQIADGHGLIKIVRSLDQDGTGEKGENLDRLWSALSLSSAGQFYAAEQSILRWLLKMMNPATKTSADSETIRRYPLTWNILNCVFQRVPLFSLAKALADRRFIAVLRQTAKDIASPTPADDSKASSGRKRKRSSPVTFDSSSLRNPDGCIRSADALFAALATLLSRLNPASDTTRDAVGAEHIKSLFASPSNEALEIVGPLFNVCENSVEVVGVESDGRASWIKAASDIWDLRLRGKADALDVATYISQTALPMFGKLDAEVCKIHGGTDSYSALPLPVRRAWVADLRDFLQRNLLLPARASFMGAGDLEVLKTVVLMTRRHAAVTSPALYLLAQNSPKPMDEKSRQKVSEWMNEVLKAIEGTLPSVAFETRTRVLEGILVEAQKNEIKINDGVLMGICSKYGFEKGSIHWSVVSAVLKLDPDMIFEGDKGQALLGEVIKSIRGVGAGSGPDGHYVMNIIDAIITAFTNAKDFTGYLKLWYEELSRIDHVSAASPWLQSTIRYDKSVFSKQKLELEITVKQLLDVLEWLASQEPVHPESLHVILDSIAHGLKSPEFTDVAGPKISGLVVKLFTSTNTQSGAIPLRWSILSQVIPWLAPDARDRLWAEMKLVLVEVLEQGKLSDEDTLQALKFIFVAWSLMMPDADLRVEVASIALAAARRLAKEIPSKLGKKAAFGWKGLQRPGEPSEEYLAWYMEFLLRASSRALPLLSTGTEDELTTLLDKILKFLHSVDKRFKPESDEPEAHRRFVGEAFKALLSNENVLNSRTLIDKVIDSMSGTLRDRLKKVTDELIDENVGGLFLTVPDDCFTRPQREHLASLLLGRIQAIEDTVDVSPTQWKLILAVLTKLMKRPTFCEELDFNSLMTISEKASRCFETESGPRRLGEMRGLVPLYQELIATVMSQMASHFESRGQKFFEDAASYVKDCAVDEKSVHRSRLGLLLLTALGRILSESSSVKGQVSLTPEAVQRRLAEAVANVLHKCCKYWKKKPRELYDGSYLHTLLVILDSAEIIAPGCFEDMAISVDRLVKASNLSIQSGRLDGWKLRAFLLKHYPDSVEKTLDLARSEPGSGDEAVGNDGEALDVVQERDLIPLVLECTEATLQTLNSEEAKLLYLRDLLDKLEFGRDTETQLTAIRCVVAKLSAVSPSIGPKDFDLASAYTILVRKALQADSGARFGKICEILRVILDGTPGHVCQWNIEETLVLAATVCSEDAAMAKLKDSERTYKHLCKLVEMILRKYRLRLEGHFHLLIATMQALLRALLLHPYDSRAGAWVTGGPPAAGPEVSYDAWEEHAGAYNRLVTLVCEPTAGSVTRSHHGGALDAATDVAKRAAGRQMYLVLMAYVRLQMEVGVPRGVREALESGVNAVFDVTPDEVRKVMNDGLDRAGREMMGDLYKRYRTFGKWSGK
ncbi:uncharacterized protein DNG_05681 [Cephalotrichum gorgonifer]|uniref:Nucleolar 27S pre-rRNA processing Urb2/Npa2 C-terminal domain-containing protein n=1 Tax=Cephalotrichum gorgonifer TaxID=2041049 RepID=A0AAE8SVP5_9PEZI|nr:uncharacterized protein DNG_05681 [Cephalotrichum gorgonifer]